MPTFGVTQQKTYQLKNQEPGDLFFLSLVCKPNINWQSALNSKVRHMTHAAPENRLNNIISLFLFLCACFVGN
jgi:hypothetical protein